MSSNSENCQLDDAWFLTWALAAWAICAPLYAAAEVHLKANHKCN